jgi:hypothetical protein
MASAPGDPASDDRFGFSALVSRHPPRIRVRGVDEIEACADERIEQIERGRFIGESTPKTFPPKASGAISNPVFPSLRLFIALNESLRHSVPDRRNT